MRIWKEQRGDETVFLILFLTGARGIVDQNQTRVLIGGSEFVPDYVGPAPGYFGLDQVNVLLPAALRGTGDVSVTLTVDGQNSNTVALKFVEGAATLMAGSLEKGGR